MEVKILLYQFRIFFAGKSIWTYASSFSFEDFLVSVQLFSLSPAYQLPGICLLMVEMCRGLVSWLADWLTLQFCSYGASLHVLKNYYRQARKKKKSFSLVAKQHMQPKIQNVIWTRISLYISPTNADRIMDEIIISCLVFNNLEGRQTVSDTGNGRKLRLINCILLLNE